MTIDDRPRSSFGLAEDTALVMSPQAFREFCAPYASALYDAFSGGVRVALEAMAPCGGFMLGDGANVCPGTPLANLAALTEASEEYGIPSHGR